MFRSIFRPSSGGKVSPSQVLHIHTQTDGNDIRPHTAQIYNERTSADLGLVTAQSTVHEPPEDGLKTDRNM